MMTLRKLTATVLAAGLPFVAACRVACAAGMAPVRAAAVSAVTAGDCCRHQRPADGDQRRSICCADAGAGNALLQAPAAVPADSAISAALPPAAVAAAPAASVRAVSAGRPPPLAVQDAPPSCRGSRAPPPPAAVL